MSLNPTPRRPFAFRLYLMGVLAVAALLAGSALAHPPAVSWVRVFLGVAMLAVLEWRPLPVITGAGFGAGLVVTLPLVLMVGPFWTAAASVLAITGVAIARRRPFERSAHAAALAILSAYAAGACFVLLGGRVGEFEFPGQALSLVVTGFVLFAVESLGVAAHVGLTHGPGVGRVWERAFWAHGLHHVSFLALGLVAALLDHAFGVWGLALAILPAVLARLDFARVVEYASGLQEFVRAFIVPLEQVDPYTRHHSVRVAEYSVRLARALGLPEHSVAEIEYAALVHDIGKIGPEQQFILQKPGALTSDEFRTLQEHPETGARMVERMPGMRSVAQMVLAHHEQPDGKGYPQNLQGKDVPVGARIIHVADAFDAMTSDRPYRRGVSVEAALKELERFSGTQFDDDVVAAMLELHGRGAFPLVPSMTRDDLESLPGRRRVGGA